MSEKVEQSKTTQKNDEVNNAIGLVVIFLEVHIDHNFAKSAKYKNEYISKDDGQSFHLDNIL